MPTARTDLAVECFENTGQSAIPGARVSRWDSGGIEVTEVVISETGAARQLGKPKGCYLTLECPLLRERDPDARLTMADLLAEEIAGKLPEGDPSEPVLVVGLGNRAITPDALGPAVVDRTLATRHLMESSAHGPCAACAPSPRACWALPASRAWSWWNRWSGRWRRGRSSA